MKPPPINVAVGVLQDSNGNFLLAQRPEGKPYAGYWEFPGGKQESGETLFATLQRELHEELGLELHDGAACHPWATRVFVYPHATVRLYFWRVTAWQGTVQGREQQNFAWFHPAAPENFPAPLLPATVPVLRWLALPTCYAISAAEILGTEAFLRRVRQKIAAHALPFLQLREPHLSATAFGELFSAVRDLTQTHGTQLLVNSIHPRQYWARADGVHLTAHDAAQFTQRPENIAPQAWLSASAHHRAELEHAGKIGCDFAVLGSVNATPSHPDASGLGWAAWHAMAQHSPVPVYAIGGLTREDAITARHHGAQGIAAIRAVWEREET